MFSEHGRYIGNINHLWWIRCSPCTQGVEASTPTGGTCPNNFSDPKDQDIRTQLDLSWKIVVSEWRSVIAVSLNVGSDVRLIKPAKLYMCMQTLQTQRGRTHGAGCVWQWFRTAEPLEECRYENRNTHTHTHTHTHFGDELAFH